MGFDCVSESVWEMTWSWSPTLSHARVGVVVELGLEGVQIEIFNFFGEIFCFLSKRYVVEVLLLLVVNDVALEASNAIGDAEPGAEDEGRVCLQGKHGL